MRLYKRTFKQENRREVENTDKKSWTGMVQSIASIYLVAALVRDKSVNRQCLIE